MDKGGRRRRHREVCPGWTEHTCKKTGKPYYHHLASGKTTWVRPAEAPVEEEEPPAAAAVPTAMSEGEFEAWLEGLRGRSLTVSQARRLATLAQAASEKAAEVSLAETSSKEFSGRSLSSEKSGLSSLKLSMRTKRDERQQNEELPAGWTKHKDSKSGKWFYRNEARRESTWRKPTDDRYRTLWRYDEETKEEPVQAESCVRCGRSMAETALDKMEKVHGIRCCPKCAPQKRRQPYNAAAHRAEGIAATAEDRQLVKRGIAAVQRDLKPPSKWKAQSDQLRSAMKSMRAAAAAEKAGKPPPPMAPSAPDPTFVQCPHCERRFNQQAADRHIPKCRDIKAKPKMLKRGAGTPGPVRRHLNSRLSGPL
ncbi:hypothetical protein CTAYLR_005903 [Chrysophaeum taylorii]|uniref:WW domain-containing protein n=1 Tax=Chrysophaeum taylorii TaxID=2483200 RepID=A0AAD7XUS2_9STRA|nr:hypothetical protein CTAYLR_005876 [Chrysophaeum taylorii]KAJ8614330.1 hypothetical protein CTAYLR_005903 [Chrysophaeum taylorii]